MNISYQLYIQINKQVSITIGKFGTYNFLPGTYIYTGSAKKNIEARVARHLKKEKKLKWHIDYLLSNPNVDIIEVQQSETPECILNQSVSGIVLVPGFGSSDCKNSCRSHLKKIR